MNVRSLAQDPPFQTPSQSSPTSPPLSSSRASKSKGEWDTPTRCIAKGQYIEGATRRRIREITGIPERTQKRITRKDAPYRRPGALRKGPKEQIDRNTLHRMIDYATANYTSRTVSFEALRQIFTPAISQARTVKRHLNNAGFYKCKACQKSYLREINVQKRYAFCDAHMKMEDQLSYWQSVKFSDEVHVFLESRSAEFILRQDNERYCDDCMQFNKRSRKGVLHAWAMVGYGGFKTPLIWYDVNEFTELNEDPAWQLERAEQGDIAPAGALETEQEEHRLLRDTNCSHKCKNKQECKHACCKGYKASKHGGNLTQLQYLNYIFKPYIEPALRRAQLQGESFVLMEDNDNCHGTRSSNNPVFLYKESLEGFHYYANPPQSPDFNIIEKCWRIMKQRVKQRKPTTLEELKQYCEEEWGLITPEQVDKMVKDMPKKVEECWRRGGLHTPW